MNGTLKQKKISFRKKRQFCTAIVNMNFKFLKVVDLLSSLTNFTEIFSNKRKNWANWSKPSLLKYTSQPSALHPRKSLWYLENFWYRKNVWRHLLYFNTNYKVFYRYFILYFIIVKIEILPIFIIVPIYY